METAEALGTITTLLSIAFAPYIILCFLVAAKADHKQGSFLYYLLVSLIFTPFMGVLLAILSEPKPIPDKTYHTNTKDI